MKLLYDTCFFEHKAYIIKEGGMDKSAMEEYNQLSKITIKNS